MADVAYVNGVFSGLGEAKVSIEDRGFQFADGVYEVVVAIGGRPFRLQQHLDRLRRSTDAIELPVDYARLDLPAVIREGLRRSELADCMVYLQITRGAVPREHVYPDNVTPTVVATFKPKPVYPAELRAGGVPLEIVRDFRWERCYVKSIALLPNVMAKNTARRHGCFDAVLVGPDDVVRETTSANVFIASGGALRTPPADERILHGVTRGYVLECARALGLRCEETYFKTSDLLAADEAFISSTTIDIMPVASVDGHPIGSGGAGELTRRLHERFLAGIAAAR